MRICKTRTLTGPYKTFQTGGRIMKGITFLILVSAISLVVTACVSDGQNTQRGAVLGGILGAVAGQAIGHNTTGTLIGAGAGALTGAMVGNIHDQQAMEWRMQQRRPSYPERPYGAYYGAESPPYDPDKPYAGGYRGSSHGQYAETPSGYWADVPGQWVSGKWVPSHKVWVPANPGSSYRR